MGMSSASARDNIGAVLGRVLCIHRTYPQTPSSESDLFVTMAFNGLRARRRRRELDKCIQPEI